MHDWKHGRGVLSSFLECSKVLFRLVSFAMLVSTCCVCVFVCSVDAVQDYLDSYFERARQILLDDPQHTIELCVLCTQCLQVNFSYRPFILYLIVVMLH